MGELISGSILDFFFNAILEFFVDFFLIFLIQSLPTFIGVTFGKRSRFVVVFLLFMIRSCSE